MYLPMRVAEPGIGRSPEQDTLRGWAVVDLFCGIGGLTHGLQRAGLEVVAGVDADPTCRYAFEANNRSRFIHAPLERITEADIRSWYPPGAGWILVGCAPCTPFSAYVAGAKRKSDKWSLVDLFMDRIADVQPDIVSMENVVRLTSFDGGRVFKRFLRRLQARSYHISVVTVDASSHGVPQHRHRLVLLASRLGPIRLPESEPLPQRTVRQAIGHLAPIRAGETHPGDPVHRAANLSPLNLRRIQASRQGGSWADWRDPDLVARCHRRTSGATYKNVYGRMEWDRPAPTMTTGCFSYGRGRFGHPVQDRAISLREAALLQSFPAAYDLVPAGESASFTHLGRHIGNAVPVALAEVIGRGIRRHIKEHAA